MKFRYYITDTYAGTVIGTNNLNVATDFATSEDHFVVDALSGEMLMAVYSTNTESVITVRSEIEEVKPR